MSLWNDLSKRNRCIECTNALQVFWLWNRILWTLAFRAVHYPWRYGGRTTGFSAYWRFHHAEIQGHVPQPGPFPTHRRKTP